MHGQGYMPPPQRPSHGVQIGLRVLFVALAVLSIGFLAWTALLRLALTTRSRTDWIIFASVAALQAGTVALLATDPGVDDFTTWRGDAGMIMLLVTLAGVVLYYLVADILHCRKGRLGFYGGYASGYQPQQQFRQPRSSSPRTGIRKRSTTRRPRRSPRRRRRRPCTTSSPRPRARPPRPCPPRPAAPGAAAHRIDQVRAELDELSDYLRKQEGGR